MYCCHDVYAVADEDLEENLFEVIVHVVFPDAYLESILTLGTSVKLIIYIFLYFNGDLSSHYMDICVNFLASPLLPLQC